MKLNQTQRKYVIDTVAEHTQKCLIKKGIELTPTIFKELVYGIQKNSIFNVHLHQNSQTKKWELSFGLNRTVTWASENVCESKKEIRKSILNKCTTLPSGWYKEEWDKGNYDVEANWKDCASNSYVGAPVVTVKWHNLDEALRKLRRAQSRKVNTVIQETVEAYQSMNECMVDCSKYLKIASRKAMLTDTESAEQLLETVQFHVTELCK